MAEDDAAGDRREHPGRKAFLNTGHRSDIHGLEDAHVGTRRNDGHRLDQPPRVRSQARNSREDSVLDCCRKRVPAGGEHFGDEEGVTASVAVQQRRVESVWRRELRDCGLRQRFERETRNGRAGRDVADEHPQRVGAVDLVVPVRTDHQRRRRLHLADEQPDDIQGGFVSPVEILQDHNHGRAGPQVIEERRGDFMGSAAADDHRLEVAGGCVGDVEERAEWVWRGKRVAPSREDSHGLIRAEAPHQRGLADARLTADENEAAGRRGRDGGQVGIERCERFRPLEQFPQAEKGLRCRQSPTSP